MKRKILLITLLIFQFAYPFQQKENLDISNKRITKSDSSNQQSNPHFSLLDKEEGKTATEITDKAANSIFVFVFPSLIALSVGLIALFGTVYTGKKQRELSERLLKEQLKQSRKTVDAQIKTSKETLDKQIESAEKNALLQFRQNVLSTNRQKWINDFRDLISEIMALTSQVGLAKNITYQEAKHLDQLITKAELMVNPDKDSQFIGALAELQLTMYKVLEGEEYEKLWKPKDVVLDFAKKTLKTEWERVKKGE